MKKFIGITALGLFSLLVVVACNSLPGGLPGGDTSAKTIAAFLPDGVSLDVSELPDEDNPAAKSKDAAALENLTPFQRTLRAAARIVFNFHRMADRALALGARIHDDMISKDQTQVQGNFTINNLPVPYKADFAAFDIDGDGQPDGSGNAVDAPVALRVWVDNGNGYQPFLCALVSTKPDENNLGAGTIYTKPGAARADAPADLQLRVNWDRTDAAHKWNEAFISGRLADNVKLTNGHQRVDVRQATDAASLEKTVRSAANFAENPYGMQSNQASVHFKPGSGFALLNGTATGTGGSFSFNDVCVDLANQALAIDGQCSAFDTQDMGFIDLPVGGETNFPADFPATPTF